MNLYHSEQLGELAAALAKAQSKIKHADKDAHNPHFKSTYAGLHSVWDACRGPLSENNLSVVQFVRPVQDGHVDGATFWALITMMLHSSGQWIRGEYPIRPVKNDPQGFGGAITYARRFSLAAMTGVAPGGDDDDGEAATNHSVTLPMAKKEEHKAPTNLITNEERALLFALAQKKAIGPDEVKKRILQAFSIEKTSLLTKPQYKYLVDLWTALPDAPAEAVTFEKFPFEKKEEEKGK